MALEATKKRLREAAFFLRLLAGTDKPTVLTPEPEASEFYLNAFVSAARSVEWILKKEMTAEWEAWIPGWKGSLNEQERAIRAYFVDQRNKIEKEGGPELTVTVTPVSLVEFMSEVSSQGGNVFIQTAPPGTPPPTVSVLYKSLTEHPGQTLSAACQPFFDLTDRLVTDFERDHGVR